MIPPYGNATVIPDRELKLGELRRQVRLGTEAVYRVCGWDERVAEVEVVRAPGLSAGQRFRFTVEAVSAMAVVGESDDTEDSRAGAP